jgi:hypothetical protein
MQLLDGRSAGQYVNMHRGGILDETLPLPTLSTIIGLTLLIIHKAFRDAPTVSTP